MQIINATTSCIVHFTYQETISLPGRILPAAVLAANGRSRRSEGPSKT
jgi:hypothetical protein